MNAKDQYKLVKQGFTIIREDNQRLKIKQKTAARSEWHDMDGSYKSKARMRRCMDELLKRSDIIED